MVSVFIKDGRVRINKKILFKINTRIFLKTSKSKLFNFTFFAAQKSFK